MKNFYKNKMIKVIIVSLMLFPALTFAVEAVPLMSFWGDVVINNDPAPVGTIIRAYYGEELAGQITVQEEGKYGYTESAKQGLGVKEGKGPITFSFQSDDLNDGLETKGRNLQAHPSFVDGDVIKKNFNFSFAVEASPPPTAGGGGGGGFVAQSETPEPSTLLGDISGNSRVGIFDFNILMINWGKIEYNNIADLNGDGRVDMLDFNILMVNWTG